MKKKRTVPRSVYEWNAIGIRLVSTQLGPGRLARQLRLPQLLPGVLRRGTKGGLRSEGHEPPSTRDDYLQEESGLVAASRQETGPHPMDQR